MSVTVEATVQDVDDELVKYLTVVNGRIDEMRAEIRRAIDHWDGKLPEVKLQCLRRVAGIDPLKDDILGELDACLDALNPEVLMIVEEILETKFIVLVPKLSDLPAYLTN